MQYSVVECWTVQWSVVQCWTVQCTHWMFVWARCLVSGGFSVKMLPGTEQRWDVWASWPPSVSKQQSFLITVLWLRRCRSFSALWVELSQQNNKHRDGFVVSGGRRQRLVIQPCGSLRRDVGLVWLEGLMWHQMFMQMRGNKTGFDDFRWEQVGGAWEQEAVLVCVLVSQPLCLHFHCLFLLKVHPGPVSEQDEAH